MKSLLTAVTCLKLCAALGYEFPFAVEGDCLCVEHPPFAIVPFESHKPKGKKSDPEYYDSRPYPNYEGGD